MFLFYREYLLAVWCWVFFLLCIIYDIDECFLLCSFLAKRGVKEEIQTFDARKITPEIRKGVEDLIRKSKDSFEPAVY